MYIIISIAYKVLCARLYVGPWTAGSGDHEQQAQMPPLHLFVTVSQSGLNVNCPPNTPMNEYLIPSQW